MFEKNNPCRPTAELFWVFIIHLKLELLMQFPALNEEKYLSL